MSADNSGGVCSSTVFAACVMSDTDSRNASSISSELTVIVRGNPLTISRPRIEISSFRAPLNTVATRSEEHTSELQSRGHLVCRLLLEKKKGLIIQRQSQ